MGKGRSAALEVDSADWRTVKWILTSGVEAFLLGLVSILGESKSGERGVMVTVEMSVPDHTAVQAP